MANDDSYDRPSLLPFDLLPSLLSQKLPKRVRQRGSIDEPSPTCHSRPLSQASMDSITPPPSYQSDVDEPPLAFMTPPAFRSLPMSAAPSRPSSSGSITPTNHNVTLPESASGIHWKYANTGFALLSLASQEDANASASSVRLTRRGYIDGVACMLRGLPADLSEEEELSLREALPESVRQTHAEDEPVAVTAVSAQHQSALHRCIASLTVSLCLAISFLLPYLQLLLRQAYQFDRKHKISDRVLAQSVSAADWTSKRTLTIASSICAMNDGKVGDSMRELGVYFVQGVGGGVYEGLGEGMQVLGLRSDGARRRI